LPPRALGSDGSPTIQEVAHMADKDSGPKAGIKGVVEDVKGKAKQAAGALTSNEDMKNEGEAQQEKADAQREVAEHEARAEKARGESEAQEAQQRAHQA
jgi:uncharacterized protein YjbJ (UPF0337 family)